MQAHTVVVRDVAAKELFERCRVREDETVYGVALHGVEERLHVRVVRDLPRPVHALHEAEGSQPLAEQVGRVLDTPVAVEDDTGPRAPIVHSAVERRKRQPRVSRGPETPADDAAGVAIHHDREVAPRTADLQVREIAHPDLIGSRGQSIELMVGNAGEEPVQARDAPVEVHRAGPQAGLAHEPGDASTADPDAGAGQRVEHPRTAIGAAAALEDRLDLVEQYPVLLAPGTLAAAAPRIVARPRDAIQRAHAFQAQPCSLAVDEFEDLRLRAEENRMAFFKSWCSTLSIACSRLRLCRALSSRVDRNGMSPRGLRPLTTPSRTSFRQRESMNGWMSRALATVWTSTPGMWLSFTAVSLNSVL